MARAARRRLAAALAVIAGIAFGTPLESREIGFTSIDIGVSTIENFEPGRAGTTFGALEFRGGLVLRSHDPDFGALSGLDFMPDGSLLAAADTSSWFSARLVESGGRLVGIEAARLAPMLAADGRPLAGKRQGDAESLRVVTRDGRTDAVVSFEMRNDVRHFAALPDVSLSKPAAVPLPKAVSGIRRTAGLEALAAAPEASVFGGALAIVAERSLDAKGNHRGWILGGPRRGAFSIVRSGDFDVTDAAFLPGGDLLILERF